MLLQNSDYILQPYVYMCRFEKKYSKKTVTYMIEHKIILKNVYLQKAIKMHNAAIDM